MNKTIYDEDRYIFWFLGRWTIQDSTRKWPYHFSPSKDRVCRYYREKLYDHNKYCYDYHYRILFNKTSDEDKLKQKIFQEIVMIIRDIILTVMKPLSLFQKMQFLVIKLWRKKDGWDNILIGKFSFYGGSIRINKRMSSVSESGSAHRTHILRFNQGRKLTDFKLSLPMSLQQLRKNFGKREST